MASSALAGTTQHEVILPLASTNWNTAINVPKHDMAEGCLDSVCVELVGHVEGSAAFESQDAAPAAIAMDLAATLTLQRPDLSTLVTTIPVASTIDSVTSFDGVIDFGGTSGKTYAALSGDQTEDSCSSSPADLLLFTGVGNIGLPVDASGTSSGSGAGNLILQFSTSASATARVTYHWTECPVPTESTTWGTIKTQFRN